MQTNMGAKKLILTQKQLNEIIGYCDNVPDNYANNAGNEVFVSDTQVDNEGNENYGEPIITDKYGHSITNDVGALWKIGGVAGNLVMRESKKKIIKNDEGEIVPEFCPECGSKVGLFIQGEPIYKCTNKKCGKYFGTMPFPKNLKEESAHGNSDIGKNEKFGANNNFNGNTYNAATVKKHRYEKAKEKALNGTPEEKKAAQKTLNNMQKNSLENGENIEQTINQLNNREKQTKQLRKNRMENGESVMNVTNRSKGGTAHSKKDNNKIIINYF